MQHGTPEQCAALRVQAIQEQQRQVVQQVAPAPPLAPTVAEQPALPAQPGLVPNAPTPAQQIPAPGDLEKKPKQHQGLTL